MREPFILNVQSPAHPHRHAVWKEISFGDGASLSHFFKVILDDKTERLAYYDSRDWYGLSRKEKRGLVKDARAMIFSLRDFPLRIDQILPLAARVGLPNAARLMQQPADVKDGIGGRHIAVLWDKTGQEILGVATLEKTAQPAEAEVAGWVHPNTDRQLAFAAWTGLMNWSRETMGYKDFVAHTEATTNFQRGNLEAVFAAVHLGFKDAGVRWADDPKGNGKDTVILKARNWQPPRAKAAGMVF